MVSERVLPVRLTARGFTAAELLVVIAIVGIIAATSVPWMITYWRAATLRAGAEEVAAALNRGRQLAITQGQRVCVEVVGSRYRYRIAPVAGNACLGTPWTGPGTDGTGFFSMTNSVALTTNVNPVFDYLGAANPGATMSVTNTGTAADGTTLNIVVSASGRVRIGP